MQSQQPTPGPPAPPEDAPRSSRSILKSWEPPAWLLAIGFGVVVIVSGVALDVLMEHRHKTLWTAIAPSDAMAALVAATLFHRLLRYERERRRAIRRRLEIIAEINHHVRNAVYIISLSTHSSRDMEMVKLIQNSLKRIDWALKEILPKL